MKTKKALVKRFKKTGTGKLVRYKQGRRHLLTKKSSKRKRRLGTPTLVESNQLKRYKELMCAL